jgi:outer membrane protein OmpA-like peptidoglycan-associated protein
LIKKNIVCLIRFWVLSLGRITIDLYLKLSYLKYFCTFEAFTNITPTMKKHLLLLLLLPINLVFAQGQNNLDFAVELAAFDQSVPLSYFKGIVGVYETYDINQIYRYHISASNKTEADDILGKVKSTGFPNARIIDFVYIRSVCEAQCGYIPPTPTGKKMLGAKPPINNSTANNTKKKSISINASSLLGDNVVTLPKEYDDADWLNFLDRNKDIGLTEAELLEVYKKHGNIRIEHAPWFEFKKKNEDLAANNLELMELYIKNGNIKIDIGTWVDFKKERGDVDAEWLGFLENNADLGATDAELRALFAKHGNIKISQAIWAYFKAHPEEYSITNNTNILSTTDAAPKVQTVSFVMFEFGGVTLTTTTIPKLDKVATALVKNKNLQIELTGHADAVGNASNNRALSLRRAAVIQQYLVNRGVAKNSIKITAKGEDHPIAINNNKDGSDCPEGRKYNRRVDLVVLDPDGNVVQIVSNIEVPDYLLSR